MKNSLLPVALACALLTPNLSWSKQQVQVAPLMAVQGGAIDINAALKQQLEQQKKNWHQEMQVLIADVDRVCQLSEEQKAKLGVAAKGAVEKCFAVAKKQSEQMFAMMGDAGGADIEVVADEEKADEVGQADENVDEQKGQEAQAGIVQGGGGQVVIQRAGIAGRAAAIQIAGNLPVMAGGEVTTPANQEIWTKTMNSVLTEDQTTRYGAVVDARKKHQAEAKQAAFLANVDSKLLLATDQTAKLKSLLDQYYGGVDYDNQGINFRFAGALPAEGTDDFAKELATVLTEPQLGLWQENFQSALDFAKMRLGQPGAGGVFRAIPAMPLAPAAPVRNDEK